MDEAIRTAAAAFYKAHIGEPVENQRNSEKKGEEPAVAEAAEAEPEGSKYSFINYAQLAESAVSASDVLSVSPELKKMIESEKVVLKDQYYQANSALFIILDKLLKERGVKVKNLTAKTGFLNNAVFKFDASPVEADARNSDAEDIPLAPITPSKFEEADATLEPGNAFNPTVATPVTTATRATPVNATKENPVKTQIKVGGGRTRSLLKSIRRLTKKNIRRMI